MPLDFEILSGKLPTQPDFQKTRRLFGSQVNPTQKPLSYLSCRELNLSLHEVHYIRRIFLHPSGGGLGTYYYTSSEAFDALG